jgi:hypothetical protein
MIAGDLALSQARRLPPRLAAPSLSRLRPGFRRAASPLSAGGFDLDPNLFLAQWRLELRKLVHGAKEPLDAALAHRSRSSAVNASGGAIAPFLIH